MRPDLDMLMRNELCRRAILRAASEGYAAGYGDWYIPTEETDSDAKEFVDRMLQDAAYEMTTR